MVSTESSSTTCPPVSASSAPPPASTLPTSPESTKNDDDDPPTVRFTSIRKLFNTIDSTAGDFLVVTDVSPDQFNQIERAREKRLRKFRFRRYSEASRILIITITLVIHEVLHLDLYQKFYIKLFQNGMHNSWRPFGASFYRSLQGYPAEGGGEGDSTGGPAAERGKKGGWPTLVINAGYTEPLRELHNDMRWWFSASDHQVKIVLLAKFDRIRSLIILEKWEEEEAQPRQGATTTRRFAAVRFQPMLRQTITIAQNTTTNPVSYNITGGTLILSFKLLFLRDPGPGEADVVFTIQDLEGYAETVWDRV